MKRAPRTQPRRQQNRRNAPRHNNVRYIKEIYDPAFRKSRLTETILLILSLVILISLVLFSPDPAWARPSAVAPWSTESGFQELVYGSSSALTVVRVMGREPDDIIRTEQMFPLLENYYYYDSNKSGAATVFVFQNGLLVGLHYKSPSNQFIDLTYFLINNGDRRLNSPLNAGYYGYYPNFGFYTPEWYLNLDDEYSYNYW